MIILFGLVCVPLRHASIFLNFELIRFILYVGVQGALPYLNIGVLSQMTQLNASVLNLGPNNRVVDIESSALSLSISTSGGQLWTVGDPYAYDTLTLMNSKGNAFRGRRVDVTASFTIGGGLVASYMTVPDSPENYIPSTSSILQILGSSFGSDLDGIDAQIRVWTNDTSKAMKCGQRSRSFDTLACILDTTFAPSEVGHLVYANISISGELVTNAIIGTLTAPPALFDSVDQQMATNADELVLSGSGLLSVLRVELSSGQCTNITLKTSTTLRCSVSNMNVPESGLLRAAVVVVGQSEASIVFLPVARAVKRTFILFASF